MRTKGKPLLCRKCGHPYMTFVKKEKGVYEHLNPYHCLMATTVVHLAELEIEKRVKREKERREALRTSKVSRTNKVRE